MTTRLSWKYWIFLPLIAVAVSVAIGCGSDSKKASGGKKPVVVHPGGGSGGGHIPGAGKMVHAWGEQFYITNDDHYRNFLRDFGLVCDPYSWLNIGWVNCKNWDSRAYLEIGLQAGSIPSPGVAVLYAFPEGYYGPYGLPLLVRGTYEKKDNGTKFEMRVRGLDGTPAYNGILKIIVTGLPTDPQVRVDLIYKDIALGYGVLYRYTK